MPQELVCKECGRPFLFEDAEQERYARDGFEPPRRCRPCRAARRAAGRPPSERLPRPAPPPAPPRDPKGRPLHEAQCGACGALTRVPFEPSDVRPVYCAVCFEYR
ncbi:MAG: zinc-ribbon domain containing protein [Planctomycetes bacterium]|nr:zinc-ribbon domain containing protein [Planctomycetota bacterium]